MTHPAPQFEYGHLLDRTTTVRTTGRLYFCSPLPSLSQEVRDSIRVGSLAGVLQRQDAGEGSVTVGPPVLGKDKLRRDLARIVTGMPGEILAGEDADQKTEASE